MVRKNATDVSEPDLVPWTVAATADPARCTDRRTVEPVVAVYETAIMAAAHETEEIEDDG